MVYRLINATFNVEELTLRLTRLICQFIKADACTIYILDVKTGKVILQSIFNNKINILVKKKKELAKVTDDERHVLDGYSIRRKDFIGMPLVADEVIGALFIRRKKKQASFNEFDKDMLSVVAEQSVTAIKNLQLNEEQQKVILSSIEFIGQLLERHGHAATKHTPVYFKIVKCLGEMLNAGEDAIENLYYASILRDAGAIDVPYDILAKSERLTAEEFKIIRNVPIKNVEMFESIEFLKPVLPIILYHHEKYDGSGYPSGIKKEQIPFGARIMAVVDAFEAMTIERPYKNRLSVEETIEEIKRNSGTQFDPKVVNAFVSLSKQKKFKKYLSSTRTI